MSDSFLRLDANSTTLLLIDLQERLMPVIAERERVIRGCRLLLRLAGVLRLPVIATTQYEKGLGPMAQPIAELLPEGATRLEKTTFSCFDDLGFAANLVAGSTLIVAGVEAHICVAGTVLGARRQNLAVEVAVDAVSSRRLDDAGIGVQRMAGAGALLTTSEMVTYELIKDSRSPAFREMLPHLRS